MAFIEKAGKYTHITELVNSGGRLEIGYIYELGISAMAVDEGGTIWEGKKSYESIEDALADAERGIGKWMEENW